MTHAPLRIALVGAGSMGSLHARVISQSPRSELAYVIDPKKESGAALAERFDATWAADLDGMHDVQAVLVASATETHHAIGMEILASGLPLLMEKPLADRLADAEELVAMAVKGDVPLMCGLLERYNPAIMTAMRIVEDPWHVTAVRHSPYVSRVGTGVGSDLLIHDIDAILRMARSDVTVVRASFGYLHPESRNGCEDVAETMIGFADGMVANVSASRVSQRKVRRFEIAEKGALIEVDMLRNAVTIYRHVLNEASQDGLTYRQQTIIEIPTLISSREPLAAQLDRFIDIATGQVDPAEERATILPAHQLLEAVRADALAP